MPLRLWDTRFPLVDPDIRGPHAHGYAIDTPPDWGLPAILDTTRSSPTWAWTAGAIVSTLDDVADFHRALFSGRLLRPAEQRELLTTVPASPGLDYGLGRLHAAAAVRHRLGARRRHAQPCQHLADESRRRPPDGDDGDA